MLKKKEPELLLVRAGTSNAGLLFGMVGNRQKMFIKVISIQPKFRGTETMTNEMEIIAKLMTEYAKQKAIAFANWKDRYMNNPPIGKLASNDQLFDLFNSEVHKEEQK